MEFKEVLKELQRINGPGKKLKALRKSRNLTQQELADIFDISKYSIVNYENGHKFPGYEVILKFEMFYGVNALQLEGIEPIPSLSDQAIKTQQIEDAVIMPIGEKIKILRKEHGISQKELAQRMNVSQGLVAHYEKGFRKPKIETIQKFATALNLSLTDVLKDVDDQQYTFPDILKQLRKNKGLTQEELAQNLNVSLISIKRYETGTRRPNFETMHKLENFFHVTSSYLAGKSTSNEYDFSNGNTAMRSESLLKNFEITSKFDNQLQTMQRHLKKAKWRRRV